MIYVASHFYKSLLQRSCCCLCYDRLVIGAPGGSYPGGVMSLPAAPQALNNTGLVYECPVGQGNCDRVGGIDTPLFDNTGRNMNTYVITPFVF